MYFTPKTNFKLVGIDGPIPKEGEPINAKHFTHVVYHRSKKAEARRQNPYEYGFNIADSIDKYFMDQIDSETDANAFTLLLSPFEEWWKVMDTIGYTVQSKQSLLY